MRGASESGRVVGTSRATCAGLALTTQAGMAPTARAGLTLSALLGLMASSLAHAGSTTEIATSQFWSGLESASVAACQALVRGRSGVNLTAGDGYETCLELDVLEQVLAVWPWLSDQGVAVNRPLFLFFDDGDCQGDLAGIAGADMQLNLEQIPYAVDDAIGSVLVVNGHPGQLLEVYRDAPPRHADDTHARVELREEIGVACVPGFEIPIVDGPIVLAYERRNGSKDLDDTISYIVTRSPGTTAHASHAASRRGQHHPGGRRHMEDARLEPAGHRTAGATRRVLEPRVLAANDVRVIAGIVPTLAVCVPARGDGPPRHVATRRP